MLGKLINIVAFVLTVTFLLSLLVIDRTLPQEKVQRQKQLELTKMEKEKIKAYLKGLK